MAIEIQKPTSNARRNMSQFVGSKESAVFNRLLTTKKRMSGRNNTGRITVARRGGGSKRMVRIVNFKGFGNTNEKFEVSKVEYDPGRNASLALIKNEKGEKKYIIATEKMNVGDAVECADKASIKSGNRMKLKNIPPSTQIHCVEVSRGSGGVIARSAGSFAVLMGFDNEDAIIKLSSGETRKVGKDLFASIGVVSNPEYSKRVIGMAGKMRRMGIRPKVRGKAKNPCDHPHGGGEGGSSIGLKHPKTPWGAVALGRKTRKGRKYSNRLILMKGKK